MVLGQKWNEHVNAGHTCLRCWDSCESEVHSVCTWEHSTHLLLDWPWMGHSQIWIISKDWHDRIFLFLLLQGVDSQLLLQQPLIYCHFANGKEDLCYMPVKDWEVLKTFLTEALDNYNDLNAAMPLVLFEDAMQHVWVDWLWCFFTKWKQLGIHSCGYSLDHTQPSSLHMALSLCVCLYPDFSFSWDQLYCIRAPTTPIRPPLNQLLIQ